MNIKGLIIVALLAVLGSGCVTVNSAADKNARRENTHEEYVSLVSEQQVLTNFLIRTYTDLRIDPREQLPIGGEKLAAVVARFNQLLGTSAFPEDEARLVSEEERRLVDLPGPPVCNCNELVVENPLHGKIYYIFVREGIPDFLGWWPSRR